EPEASPARRGEAARKAPGRRGGAAPEPMTPGEVYELNIPMTPTGWTVPAGHRLRLAIAGSDFPNLWPTPDRAENRVYRDGGRPSRVILPAGPASTPPPPRVPPPPLPPP